MTTYVMIDPRKRLPNVVEENTDLTLGELLDYIDEGYRVLKTRGTVTWEMIPQFVNGAAVTGIWQRVENLKEKAA